MSYAVSGKSKGIGMEKKGPACGKKRTDNSRMGVSSLGTFDRASTIAPQSLCCVKLIASLLGKCPPDIFVLTMFPLDKHDA